MIKIVKNKENAIWATFSEKMENVNNWILLEFTNESNPTKKWGTLLIDNVSEYFPRIDKYIVTENETADGQIPQEIFLPLSGFYEYRAYEIEPLEYSVPGYFSIDYIETLLPITQRLIEVGRCKVDGEDQTEIDSVYK